MKKCTLCVDRIYNENLPEEDRVPACVRTCPTNARHFGDLNDPKSDVSQMVEERGGFDLLPEQNTKPVNKYLPPRSNNSSQIKKQEKQTEVEPSKQIEGFWGWLDDALEKI